MIPIVQCYGWEQDPKYDLNPKPTLDYEELQGWGCSVWGFGFFHGAGLPPKREESSRLRVGTSVGFGV